MEVNQKLELKKEKDNNMKVQTNFIGEKDLRDFLNYVRVYVSSNFIMHMLTSTYK